MQPLGWLPEWPKWKFAPSGNNPNSGELKSLLNGNVVSQQVNPDWIASIEIVGHSSDAIQCPALRNDNFTDSANTWEDPLVITALWPTAEHPKVEVSMDPSLSSDFLESQYKAYLIGNQPLALFPKQILAKARMGMESAAFVRSLHELLRTPTEIDEKFSLTSHSDFLVDLKNLTDDMHPLSDLVKALRLRDTQLQILLGLELMASVQSKTIAERESSVSKSLDLHFDRLCIWQAVDNTDVVPEFCAAVIIPFYKARASKKVKQLVRVSRGTLKLRHRSVKQIGRKRPPSHHQDQPLAMPGLVKALQMQNYAAKTALDREPNSQVASSGRSDQFWKSKTASRSISHPVYRQQPKHGQVEVRFKRVNKLDSARASPSPTVSRSDAQPDLSCDGPCAAQSEKKSPALPEYVDATPTKSRTIYLGALREPTNLFEDDNEIGSTDSDE